MLIRAQKKIVIWRKENILNEYLYEWIKKEDIVNKRAFNPNGLPKIRSIDKPIIKLVSAYILLGRLKTQKQKTKKPREKLK